jgi:hypothetical protein
MAFATGLLVNSLKKYFSEWAQESIPDDERLESVFRALRAQQPVDDDFFDRIYPAWARDLSRIHWTQVQVVKRAVELLVANTRQEDKARILDVGSGAGKFCLVGASISRARFHGIEQRARFVDLCQHLVRRYHVRKTTFHLGNMLEFDWSCANAIYLFNPFQEHRTPSQGIDDSIELRREYFDQYVNAVRRKLRRMSTGTRVVTYFGFGGSFPGSYERILSEFCHRGPLELWMKTRDDLRQAC